MLVAIFKKLLDGVNFLGISKDVDSIDVGKMSNGGTITALNGITATTTSDEIDLRGYKHIQLTLVGSAFTSGNFAVAFKGDSLTGGDFGDIYQQKDDKTYAKVGDITVNANGTATYIIQNIGCKYLKLVATRTTDGTLSAYITPFN
jgi:hypothetical protein